MMVAPEVVSLGTAAHIGIRVRGIVDDLIADLPAPGQYSPESQRGVIARYSSVLEGNFIYWMTGAYLAAKSEEARAIILGNLLEEVRDGHPGMLRRFAIAANAVPNDGHALAVWPALSKVQVFIGRLSALPIITMMAFFEDFIQKFMPYLAELATLQGSVEQQYTNVHRNCDGLHSIELFRALGAELPLASNSDKQSVNLFEGIYLLRALIYAIVPVGQIRDAANQAPGKRKHSSFVTIHQSR
jgi:hypothetical protein